MIAIVTWLGIALAYYWLDRRGRTRHHAAGEVIRPDEVDDAGLSESALATGALLVFASFAVLMLLAVASVATAGSLDGWREVVQVAAAD